MVLCIYNRFLLHVCMNNTRKNKNCHNLTIPWSILHICLRGVKLYNDMFYLSNYDSDVQLCYWGFRKKPNHVVFHAGIQMSMCLTGTVFCLGCAPHELHLEIQEQLKEYVSKENLQDAIVRHIYMLMSGKDTLELDKMLEDTTSWTQKVEVCIRHLVDCMNHSIQYIRSLMEATLARVIEARRDTFTAHPLRSKVVVLRAATASKQTQNDAVRQLSQQAVSVHQLELPLSHVAADMQCSALVNQYLDDDILEAFENKNLCETYVIQKY